MLNTDLAYDWFFSKLLNCDGVLSIFYLSSPNVFIELCISIIFTTCSLAKKKIVFKLSDLFRLCPPPPPPTLVVAYYLHPRTKVPYFYIFSHNCVMARALWLGGGGGCKKYWLGGTNGKRSKLSIYPLIRR